MNQAGVRLHEVLFAMYELKTVLAETGSFLRLFAIVNSVHLNAVATSSEWRVEGRFLNNL